MPAQLVRSKSLASIADQVLVSATNFLTTVIIGRAAGQDALGAYSLAFTVMLVVLCLQETLICVPYTIEHRQFKGSMRRQFAGSAFVQAALLAAAVTLVLAVGGLVANQLSSLLPLGLALAIAIAAPCVQLRDFARRMSFAHLVVSGAIAIDGVVLILQLGLLLVLWRLGWLSAASAYLAIAVVCAVAGIIWLRTYRRDFLPPGNRLAADMRRNWSLGRWILGSQVVSILSAYLIYWLVAGSLGKGASGVLFACSAIILLSNPITLGTYTYLTPRLAEAFALEGNRGVLRVALQTALFLAAVMTAFCLAAFAFGNVFLTVVYGKAYSGYAAVTGVYGLALLANAVGIAPEHALRVTRRTRDLLLDGTGWLGKHGCAGRMVDACLGAHRRRVRHGRWFCPRGSSPLGGHAAFTPRSTCRYGPSIRSELLSLLCALSFVITTISKPAAKTKSSPTRRNCLPRAATTL